MRGGTCCSTSKFVCSLDVLLELREVNGVLEGHLCGKETFFAVKTIERMAKHFRVCSSTCASLCCDALYLAIC